MRSYQAASTINALPEAVWSVLSDGASWPSWDSGVDAVEGAIEPGASIKIRSHAAPGRAFPVKVTRFEPPGQLQFSGGMPLGLFRGVRTYDVIPGPDGQVTFHLREDYTGPLVPLIWRSMPDLGPSFRQFATGLKQRVESGR